MRLADALRLAAGSNSAQKIPPTFVGYGAALTGSSARYGGTVQYPSGVALGDLVILHLNDGIDDPSGWNKINTYLYWKIAGAETSVVTTAISSRYRAIRTSAFRNASAPVINASSNLHAPAITTPENNCYVLYHYNSYRVSSSNPEIDITLNASLTNQNVSTLAVGSYDGTKQGMKQAVGYKEVAGEVPSPTGGSSFNTYAVSITIPPA